MQLILSTAIIVTLLTSVFIAIRWRNVRCEGSMPTSLFTFIAILFTSGLDVGLIMFPLTEFPLYTEDPAYDFANPLAMEFGFWGFLVWAFYFLTTFYFCIVEPRVKLFEIPAIKFLNNIIIISTCAFTGFLFLSYLPTYIDGITPVLQYGLVAVVVLFATLSSTDVKYVKVLSVSSTWLFFALIGGMWVITDMGLLGFVTTSAQIGEYFTEIHHFVTPISDSHAFYLFWWFSWSIMIGQFVSRFVGSMLTWHLLIALLVIPSIPIAVWFSVLYYYYENEIVISGLVKGLMVFVGTVFVMNSVDSLMRLYTVNLNFTAHQVGRKKYVLGNWLVMSALILLYQFTPLKIEWVGLLVIGLYLAIYLILFIRRKEFLSQSGNAEAIEAN